MSDKTKANLIAKYSFDDASALGKDSSGKGNDATPMGKQAPVIKEVAGRKAAVLAGGEHGNSYIKLPDNLLKDVSDDNGLTVSAWINYTEIGNPWQRIFDFGKSDQGPFIFTTKLLHTSMLADGEILAAANNPVNDGNWHHVAITFFGTKKGTLSNAGARTYLDGELISDGFISQTSSGQYKKLRAFTDALSKADNFNNNCLGHSKFALDPDFEGAFSDVRIYNAPLTEDEIAEIMCENLSPMEILTIAKERYLTFDRKLINEDITLVKELLAGIVSVHWNSSNQNVIDNDGKIKSVSKPEGVTFTATLSNGGQKLSVSYDVTILPKNLAPYTMTLYPGQKKTKISDTLFGLFYEDINNAADGGIYAEMVQNRSFENFTFDTYNAESGENGICTCKQTLMNGASAKECNCTKEQLTGKVRDPLFAWSGDLDKLTVESKGGLNEFLELPDEDTNNYYVTAKAGTTIYNKGFNDAADLCAMKFVAGETYEFSVWAKAPKGGKITVALTDDKGQAVSEPAIIQVISNDWAKYDKIILKANQSLLGKLALSFDAEISIELVSMFPSNVWGSDAKEGSSARKNFLGNSNYRLRKDLVEQLVELHPTFLRFPGGCISEGSYLWDNVYDWKDSVGPVEVRKENYNTWGYVMTLGLGYMEYFQLAEDLGATPLPVMACGVLCQARSDYANPAGGKLRQKYIQNFTDLIDFAICKDTKNNKWAAVRASMGHEEPFDLHLLGVGNENWGDEFYANFQVFKKAIDEHMAKNYPGYELTILSTVGAQADDGAYQDGWQFLSGNRPGTVSVAFSDYTGSYTEDITMYEHQADYMETIADEHYYRANDYLLNNADRYNYYYRAYDQNRNLIEDKTSKVFVGEYASNEKNTLAGAICEAAVMCGFEQNSDVVRLAAYAPLFNKVRNDNMYRWTPDLIWFDNETVWHTPNYYVQQLFAKYLGKNTIATDFSTYKKGKKTQLVPVGGVSLSTKGSSVAIAKITITSNQDGKVIYEEDFTTKKELSEKWSLLPGSDKVSVGDMGLVITSDDHQENGVYFIDEDLTDYKVVIEAAKLSGQHGIYLGVGVTDVSVKHKNMIQYAINYANGKTAIKVYKDGVEGYTLGDYSSSTAAGNLRTSIEDKFEQDQAYVITVNYGGSRKTKDTLEAYFTSGDYKSFVFDYKLEAYNKDVFSSATEDDKHIYVKLINAEGFDKKLELKAAGLKADAKRILLTASAELVNKPNVNERDHELVTPKEDKISAKNGVYRLDLPANSFTVLILDK